jgi:3-phenylpropionate/cinnamic acid dioxygenase small subunit
LQDLLDKRALDELIFRQAIAVDEHDWDAYRACFDDEVHFDFTDHTDRVIGKGFGIVESGDEWLEKVIAAVSGFEGTQHLISNTVHQLDGDRATSVCLIVAEHFLNTDRGDRSITMGGIYRFGSVRKRDGWRIKDWHLKVLWYRGNPSLYKLAAERGQAH